ncbi:MAG: MFS transporter [Deltaproteobacteria bacterium]|nr:MFS transporter [Deltaproteobacteria bacterium]
MQGSVRLYFRVCLQGFFFWLAYDLSRFPVIPLYAQKLGLPPEAIGFAVAASTMTGIFGKMISGALSDSVGRKIMMVIACVVATVLPTLYFLADSASSLIMIRLFHGLGTAIMGPVGRAFVADIVPETKRGNWLSTYTSSTNLGTMAGRSLAGFFLYWGGFFYPFAASAVAGLIALGIALRWPDDRRHPFELRPLLRRMGQGFREVGSNLSVLVTSLVEAFQYMAVGVVDAFLPIYAEGVGLLEWQIGLLFGVQMATTLLLKPFMGHLSDRFGRKPQIILGLIFGGLVLWRIPWETTFFSLGLLVILFGIAVALTTSATAALITDLCNREHYGAAHGVFGTILDVGHATGPISAGFLIASIGYRPGFVIYSVLLILASLLFSVLVEVRNGGRQKIE